MKISDLRKERLYQAIAEPLIEARIEVLKDGNSMTANQVEERISELETAIWDQVKEALDITDTIVTRKSDGQPELDLEDE